MNQKAISQVQSISIVAIIVIALVIGGSAYYISTVPTELTTVTETATSTTTTTVGGGTTTVTQTVTQTNTATQTVTATPDPVRIAMLFSTSSTVSLWDTAGLEGLKLAQERYGIEIEYVEWVTAEENERALRSLADRGFDVIFDHDSIMFDTVAKVAPDYPDIWFSNPYPSYVEYQTNQFTYSPDSTEALYLGGIVAGLATETNKIGYPIGYLFPYMWATLNAFKLGVHSVNPNAEVIDLEMLTWSDPIKGKDSALALIQQGCDILSVDFNGAGVGVIEAARENDLLTTGGANMDASGFYDLQIGTAVYSMITSISDIIGEYVRDGTLQNMDYAGGIARGWSDYIFEHPELASEETFQAVFIAKQKIASGQIGIPWIGDATPPEWGSDFEVIPHGLEGFADCTQCHQVGGAGVGAPGGTGTPDSHGWYWSGNCVVCHQP
jgi:basic membrane protein A